MGQTLLVRTALTPEMISAGRRLVLHLDSVGAVFEAAFWLLDEDTGDWHLVMSSPKRHIDGPKVLYRSVNQALSELNLTGLLSIEMISIVDEREPMIKVLSERLGRVASVDGVRLDNATVGRVRLAGCFLYRLNLGQAVAAEPSPA